MNMKLLFLVTAILVFCSCRTHFDPALGKPPRAAGDVQVAISDTTPRPIMARLDVFKEPPTRPNKEIATMIAFGGPEAEGMFLEAMMYHARRLGADAVVIQEPVISRNTFGVPNKRTFQCKAIVYVAQ